MRAAKRWWQSKGIWGSLGAGLTGVIQAVETVDAYLAAHQDVQVGLIAIAQALWQNPVSVVTIVMSFLAWYGRAFAETTVVRNKVL